MIDADDGRRGAAVGDDGASRQDRERTSTSSASRAVALVEGRLDYEDALAAVLPPPASTRTVGDRSQAIATFEDVHRRVRLTDLSVPPVKVVMTLLVRDERDIVEEHLAFHLAAGVDEVIVTDHASTDGTEEVLARYERDGRVRVLREPEGPFRQREWVTRMARLAATEHGADWVDQRRRRRVLVAARRIAARGARGRPAALRDRRSPSCGTSSPSPTTGGRSRSG